MADKIKWLTCAGETQFDVSEKGIQKVCAENDFPIIKYGDVIIVTTDHGFRESKIRVMIAGVAPCTDKECDKNKCYLHGGKKVGLWVSDEAKEHRFILPEIDNFELEGS